MRRTPIYGLLVLILALAIFAIWTRIPVTIDIVAVAPDTDLSALDPGERNRDDWIGYEIRIPAADARTIAWREIHLHAVLSDCRNAASDYPARAIFARGTLDFIALRTAARRGSDIALYAFVPRAIARRLHLACMRLEGGSHLLGQARSATVPLPARTDL
jgi:hypothetical protein